MACIKRDNESSVKQDIDLNTMDTVYLTNPKVDINHKPLIISLSSNSTKDAVKFNVGVKDTIKIKVLGISNYPIVIKECKNVSLDQINDSLFYLQVLDTMIYFEIWQDYGQGNVVSKVQDSMDSIKFVSYDGVRPVGRIK